MKKCPRCNTEKPMSAFGIVRSNKDGRHCYCRVCRNEYSRTMPSERRVWTGIKQRCNNPNNPSYGYYGGRGIRVCERWSGRDGYNNFFADMGAKPSPSHKIDRIDNDGDYCPDNCRWVTHAENCQNRRSNRVTMDKAKQIRVLYKRGMARRNLAQMYGVAWEVIDNVVKHRTWKEEK